MAVGIAVFILGLMSPAAICLYYAWRGWVKLGTDSREKMWREYLLMVGVVLASISQLLVTTFLIHGYHPEGQSYATRVSLPWLIANLTTLISWILAFLMVILGKGSMRRPLLIWCFVMPVTSSLIFGIGYTY
jgi:hypothetical protein